MASKTFVKHLIECNCILPQFKSQKDVVFHKFIVFSEIDTNDKVIPTIVKCNNCGAAHRIIEINKSELNRNEDTKSAITIEDIKISLPEKLSIILERYECELPTWQEVDYIFSNELWGKEVILVKSIEQTLKTSTISITTLLIAGKTLFKVNKFEREVENDQ
jgi:hypothetical protein